MIFKAAKAVVSKQDYDNAAFDVKELYKQQLRIELGQAIAERAIVTERQEEWSNILEAEMCAYNAKEIARCIRILQECSPRMSAQDAQRIQIVARFLANGE